MSRKSAFLPFISSVFFLSTVFISPASALLAEAVVGAVLGGAAGVAIVDRLEEKFQSVNAKVAATANIATGNALVAVESVIGGLRQAFFEERQAVFDSLSNERKALIIQIYSLLDDIEKGVDIQRGYLKADAVDLMNGVSLLTTKVRFMVTGIDPVTFAWREGGNYEMQILGVGVGLPSSAQKYEVHVEVDGIKLEPVALSSYVNMLKIRLSDTLLNSRFADSDKINTLPVKITSIHSVRCGFLWLKTCEEPYYLSFNIKLYPRIAGTAIISQIRPHSVLMNQQTLQTNEIATGDHDDKPEGVYGSGPIFAPPGWRVTRAWYDSSRCRPAHPSGENTCAFFSGPNCVIQGAAASCTVAQGSNPKIFQFSYEIAEEKTVPEQLPPSETIMFAPGQAKPIRFDRNATNVSAEVKLADGRSGRYVIKPGDTNPTRYLTCGQVAHLATEVSQTDCWVNLLD